MTNSIETITHLFYLIILLMLIWDSTRIIYRHPKFAVSVYSASRLLLLILGIMVLAVLSYAILLNWFPGVLFLDVLNGTLAAVILLPGGWANARRFQIPRLIWLRKIYFRYKHFTIMQFWKVSIGIGLLCVCYTLVLFSLFKTQINPKFLKELDESGLMRPGAEFFQIVSALTAPVYEEIIFRFVLIGALLNWIKRFKPLSGLVSGYKIGITILISTILWTALHSGMLIPFGVKEAQIFGIGIMLSWLFWNYGLEACIIAHTIINVKTILLIQLISP
ncbi:MAG: CPBP family intramembrane metalloprotease [Candidatus Sumerlaeia bacterium]|nr:CPBP family intramembrane metalloprotease [Candidatus Sumerlaeia bacterium]